MIDYENIIDNFDNKYNHSKACEAEKTIVSTLILISHAYISKAGDITDKQKDIFRELFPQCKPKEWYYIANEVRAFYLGEDINHPFYKHNLNKYNEQFKGFKVLNNKYNDFKIN
jgi:hypothetical protein